MTPRIGASGLTKSNFQPERIIKNGNSSRRLQQLSRAWLRQQRSRSRGGADSCCRCGSNARQAFLVAHFQTRKRASLESARYPGTNSLVLSPKSVKTLDTLATGHAVFGMNDWHTDGTMAEFCTAPYFAIALKPSSLSFAERGVRADQRALTGRQAFFGHANSTRRKSANSRQLSRKPASEWRGHPIASSW